MRQRAGIFGELGTAQGADVVDPADRRRALIGGEALITEDRQAFLQRQLEPIAAGDAVTRPIVEIFMGDDRGDGVEIVVGRRFLVG